MSNRRNDWEICANLLELAKIPAKKTRLSNGANLNWKSSMRYLDLLMKNGLIEEAEGTYQTTEKGEDFLKRFGELERELLLG